MLDLASRPIEALGHPLAGLGAALIFEKPSNRTRQSTEMAVVQLGGHPVYTRGDEVGFDTREPVEDIARIMSGYHAVIAATGLRPRRRRATRRRRRRAGGQPPVRSVAPAAGASPTRSRWSSSSARSAGKTVAWVGDYNNVARSLGEASAMLGMHVRFACPPGFGADEAELERFVAARCVERGAVHQGGGGRRRGRRRAHRHVGVDGPGSGEGGPDPDVRALPR